VENGLVTFVLTLSIALWAVWVLWGWLCVWCPAFVFGMRYRAATALVKKSCVYEGFPSGACISVYVEDGATIHNLEFLPELINEIYEDFEDFVDYFELDDFFSGKEAHNVTLVFYTKNTYEILDRIYNMDTRGFYVPLFRVMSIRTGLKLSDLRGCLGKTVRHEFFHYFVHALFTKGAFTEQQEEGGARVFEEW